MSERNYERFPEMADEDLRKLAEDLLAGRVFCGQQLGDQLDLMPNVFLPLALGALLEWPREDVDQIGEIYERMEKAGDRSINGYPSFFSCRLIHKDDWAAVLDLIRRMKASLAALPVREEVVKPP